jgi:hypothetical protein
MQNKMSSNIIMNENSCPRLRLDMSGNTSVAHKSMAQLQWEARQISPRKDEMVERYLEEKDEHGSQFRDAYRELKRELNMFRHYHWKDKYNKVIYLKSLTMNISKLSHLQVKLRFTTHTYNAKQNEQQHNHE